MVVLTHAYFLNEDPKERQIMKPYPPLGILYLSAYLDSQKMDHEVFDSTFSSFKQLCDHLLLQRPKVLGIYTNLMTKLNVLRLIAFVRSSPELSDCRIVLGGPELRHNAAGYLRGGADRLVIGEGEVTFYELCAHLFRRGTLSTEIPGLAWLDSEGNAQFSAERTLIRDLDSLPQPARHRIDLRRYLETWKTHHGYSSVSVSTMRGCPYTCKWCSRAVYGGTYRRRSPQAVVNEIAELAKKYSPDRIWFVDDVFTVSHKWLRGFKEELQQKKLIVPFEIITRADRMNEEVIALLKETGCVKIWIGAESGAQEIIDAMDRRVEVSAVREMIRRTMEAGMEAGTFIMLGYPGEKRRHIRETITHLKETRPNSFTITVAYPIAGTPLFEEVKSSIREPAAWHSHTDREYEFDRGHSRAFYDYAVKWVHNEVHYSLADSLLPKLKYKSKSLLAQVFMRFAG